jgi:UDP-N-acetylglucosamine acyltransferase
VVNIHPTAIVDPAAQLGVGVTIGPYCVIEANVEIGDRCQLAAHVCIHQDTVIGAENQIFVGAVLGGWPQHLRAGERAGGVRIGRANLLREYVTIHRALVPDQLTQLGDENMLMVGAHVAHDCTIGNRTILANQVLLAGHVSVADRAYLSGAVAVHQFCRIGRNAMVGGQSHIIKDVPPFVTVDGESSRVMGVNVIGLRRSGYSGADLQQIKDAYRLIYRSGRPWLEILAVLEHDFPAGPAAEFHAFLAGSQRGIVQERRRGHNVLRLADSELAERDSDLDRRAG